MSEASGEIAALFRDYQAAYGEPDPAAAIADFFVFPCLITADAEPVALTPFASRQDCINTMSRFLKLYERIGAARAETLSLTVAPVSATLCTAMLGLAICNAAGERLYAFDAHYTLVRRDGAWRIAAIAHNEMPYLLARVAAIRAA